MNRTLLGLLSVLLLGALPRCSLMNGTDNWYVSAMAKVKDPQGTPLVGEQVSFVCCLTDAGEPVGMNNSYQMPLDGTGLAQTSEREEQLSYEEGMYIHEVRWIFTLYYEGKLYCDTLYCAPLLRIKDPAQRHRCTEFYITIDSL